MNVAPNLVCAEADRLCAVSSMKAGISALLTQSTGYPLDKNHWFVTESIA